MPRRPTALLVCASLLWACDPGPTNSLGGPQAFDVEVLLGGGSILGLTTAGDATYAVGQYGLVMRTADGVRWTTLPTGSNLELYAVARSGIQFVAVGATDGTGSDGRVLTSPDGFNWQERSIALGVPLYAVAWTGARFVAAGANGVIGSSPDGIAWTRRDQSPGRTMRGVAASPTRVVAVGHDAAAYYVMSSADGLSWTVERTGAGSLSAVHWTGVEFVAVGTSVLRSPDGQSWTETPVPAAVARFTAVARAAGVYLGVDDAGRVYSAPDAATWTLRDTLGSAANAVTWTGSGFIVAGGGGAVATSVDGLSWTRRYSPLRLNLQGIARSTFRYVATGSFGHVLTSEDGASWTSHPTPTRETITDVVWTGSQFVAVTDGFDGVTQGGAKSLVSTDGVAWTVHSTGAPANLSALAYAPPLGKLLAVGGSGSILGSTDGVTWAAEASGTDASLRDVLWLGTRFLVAAEAPFMFRSTGTLWTRINPTTENLAYVRLAQSPQAIVVAAWDVVGGGPTRTLTSRDGADWQQTSAAGGPTSQALVWTGTQFVRIWAEGAQASADGLTWSELILEPSRRPQFIYDAVQVGADLTVVGSRGSIWRLR